MMHGQKNIKLDRHMTTLTVAFRNFAKTPKTETGT